MKLTLVAAEQVAQVEDERGELSSQKLPIEALRAVSQENGVTHWRRLIAKPSQEDPTGLGRVYVLSVNPSMDIHTVVSAFSALPDLVEYAEPDSVVQIQTPP